MKLTDNPILHTYATLAGRKGYHLIGAALGAVALAVAWGYYAQLSDKMSWRSTAGYDPVPGLVSEFYVSLMAMQAVVAVIAAVMVTRALTAHRVSGVLDANRLTPMSPQDLAAGYWLGPLLGPFALLFIGTLFGLFMVAVSPGFGLGTLLRTQAVVFTTTAMLGLGSAWIALEVRAPSAAIPLVLAGLLLSPLSLAGGEHFVGALLLGMPAFADAMSIRSAAAIWDVPAFFGMHVDALMVTVALQALLVAACWGGAVRKMRNPDARGITRPLGVATFAILLGAQHWLVHPALVEASSGAEWWRANEMVAATFAFGLLGAILIAIAGALTPDELRREALSGTRGRAAIALRGGMASALLAALLAGLLLFVHPVRGAAAMGLGALDLVLSTVFLAALVEGTRASGSRRASIVAGIVVGAAVLVPLLFALVFDDDLAMTAFGISGLLMVQDELGSRDTETALALFAHATMAALALTFWWRNLGRAIQRIRTTTT